MDDHHTVTCCRERIISEMMPALEPSQTKRIALKFSSLPTIWKCVDGNNEDKLRQTLRVLAQKLLNIAKKKPDNDTQPEKTLSMTKPIVLHRLSTSTFSEASASIDDSVSISAEHSTSVLCGLIGDKKYNEIVNVCQEITGIRKTSAVWTKFSKDFSRTRLKEVRDYEGQTSYQEERVPLSETIPLKIYNLYFRVRLVDVMAVVESRQRIILPLPGNDIILRTDWHSLLEDAKLKLKAYRDFEDANVSPSDNLAFGCVGGVCSNTYLYKK